MLTMKYGPAHLSLKPAPAWRSAPSGPDTPPPPRIMSPSRQMTVGDGCPSGPNKSTIRTASPRLSMLKTSFCHTSARLLSESDPTTRRQPSSSVRIPASSAVILVGIRGGSSEPQAEPMIIINRADSESRAAQFKSHLFARLPATKSPEAVMSS